MRMRLGHTLPKLLLFIIFTITISMPALAIKVTGRVLSGEGTKAPLKRALLVIKGSSLRTMTDGNGVYEMDLPVGRYTFVVSYVGFKPETRLVNITGESAVTQDFILEPLDIEIEEVVVTGTGTEHRLKNAPVQTEVMTSRMLKAYAGRTLSDLLSGLSASFDFSSSDMGSGISLGGLGNAYILILIDGKRIHGDTGGQNDLSMISVSDIERIELVKGASSSLYGSDAMAGVINIITKKNYRTAPLMLENSTRAGSYADIRQSNMLSFKVDALTSATRYAYQHTDGWQNSSQELYRNKLYEGSTTQTVSEYSNHRIQQDFEYQFGKDLLLYASGMYYYKKLLHKPGAPRWRTFHPFYRDMAVMTGAQYRLNGKSILSLDASFNRHAYFYSYYERTMDEYFRKEMIDGKEVHVPHHIFYYPGQESRESDQRRWLAHLKGVFDLSSKHKLSAGAEYIGEHLIAPRRLITDRVWTYTLSAYAQDEWNVMPDLNVTAGVRLVGHQAFGMTVTPKISTMYKIGNVNLRATYSNGFKAPTPKELYYFYERAMMGKLRVYLGNQELKPQRSHFFSGGLEYRTPKITAGATLSHNRVKDMIALVRVPIPPQYGSDEGSDYDGAMQYINMESAVITDLDLSFTVRPIRSLAIGAGYNLLSARAHLINNEESEKAGKPVLEHRTIDGTATHRANIRATWDKKWGDYALGVGLYGRIQSERFYREYGNAPGYMLWRLNTMHTWKNDRTGLLFEASVGVDNVLNHYERHPYGYNYGTTSPGRTFYAGLTIRWGKAQRKMRNLNSMMEEE